MSRFHPAACLLVATTIAAGCGGGDDAPVDAPVVHGDAVPDVLTNGRVQCVGYGFPIPDGCDPPCADDSKVGLEANPSCRYVYPATGETLFCHKFDTVKKGSVPGCCVLEPAINVRTVLWIQCF
jgi:hypothetical protein